MNQFEMPLFRANNAPINFDFVGFFSDKELKELTQLVVRYGGRVVNNENLPIKFTKPEYKYISELFPKYKLYDVQFIRDCAKQSLIVAPNRYRLGTPLLYDDCVMAHFLYGAYECCDRKVMPIEQIQIDSDMKSDSDTSSNEPLFFKKVSNGKTRSGRGKAFTTSEDKKIVEYFIKEGFGGREASSLHICEQMIEDGYLTKRTPASIYLHFKNFILPHIEKFNLSMTQLNIFLEIRDKPVIKQNRKMKSNKKTRDE